MKNTYEIRGDTAVIFARRQDEILEFIVDLDDLEAVANKPNKWCVVEPWPGCVYLGQAQSRFKNKRRISYEYTYLHRLICPGSEGKIVDHINHNTLDNRKSNLRAVSKAVNTFNRRGAQQDSRSGIRGVSWHKASDAWKAAATFRGEDYVFGYFKEIDDAKAAVEAGRKEIMRRHGLIA